MPDTEHPLFESNLNVLSKFHLNDNVLIKRGNVKTFGIIENFHMENGKVCLWIKPITHSRAMENSHLLIDPTLDILYEISVISPQPV
jgi:hypothetical protein